MLFIYNPRAGKAQIKSKLSAILEIFVKANYEVTIFPTTQRGDGYRLVKERSTGYDLVVCSGGDGTLDEIVTGMMETEEKIPIGYIPAGSTNDFGGSLQLPKNMCEAAELIVNGNNFACDIGSFNHDIFVYIAAFGLFTDVSYETKQDMKNVIGHMAYLLEGVLRVPSIHSYALKIVYDDKVIEDDFMFGMITNSVSVGGFKRITGKNVILDDGVFEVTLIKKPRNPLELNQIMTSLLNRSIDTECMYCFCASNIVIESKEEIAWTLDGEFGGNHTYIEIKNNNKAIQIRTK